MQDDSTLKCTVTFEFLYDNYRNYEVLSNEGGSRSGKTRAICHFICNYIQENTGKVITIGRDKMTLLKKTLFIDFKVALRDFYIPDTVNKTEMYFEYNGNLVRFVGFNDDPMLTHGLTQDVAWINEANSVSKYTFTQLKIRTREFIILDYNPSALQHWLYDLELRDNAIMNKTTLLDNPFLEDSIINEIMAFEPFEPGSYTVEDNVLMCNGNPIDDNNQPPPHPKNIKQLTADLFSWKVYGLGIRASDEATIYKEWKEFNEEDKPTEYDYRLLVLDFGFSSDPAAAAEMIFDGNNIYITELIYETGLLNEGLAEILLPHQDDETYCVCDSAEPKDIVDLRGLGLNAVPAKKGPDSIRHGIKRVKSFKLHVNKKSVNLQNEFRKYKYKKDEATGDILKIPVDKDNHLMDAIRYGATKFAKQG